MAQRLLACLSAVVLAASVAPELAFGTEPNNSFGAATPVACPSVSSSFAISPAGDVDFYLLSGVAGSQVDIDVQSFDLDPNNYVDTRLGVFDTDPNHTMIDENEDDTGTLDPFLQVTMPAGGQLYIAVTHENDTDYDGDGDIGAVLAGPYDLVVTCPGVEIRVEPSRERAATGSTVTACVFVDMTYATDPLGSYGASLHWDPNILDYSTSTGGAAPFNAPVINDGNAVGGELLFAQADVTGAGGVVHVFCSEYEVIAAIDPDNIDPNIVTTALDVGATSVFSTTFENLFPITFDKDSSFRTNLACTVGDVNGDGNISSGDALIVLANEVMIAIPPLAVEAIEAGCGDANGDLLTNSTDANIILSYEVMLPIDSTFPIGMPNPTAEHCPNCAPDEVLDSALSSLPLSGDRRTHTDASSLSDPQHGIVATLRSSSGRLRRGDEFEVTIVIDMGDTRYTLGSYGAVLRWDPKGMDLLSVDGGRTGGFGSPVFNDSDVADGELRVAQASPQGATGSLVELATLRFRARRALPRILRTLELDFSSMAATGPAFEDLTPLVRVERP